MKPFVHEPKRWDREAASLWREGKSDAAVASSVCTLESMVVPDADAFIQPAFYFFQLNRFDEGAALLERAVALFPDHPMVRLSLGSSYTRARQHQRAIPHLEAFLALGYADMSAFDALAHAHSETGDLIKAKIFGTMALELKDQATKGRHGTPTLNRAIDPSGKRKIIAFSLFGSGQKYLRGALHNVLAAKALYPEWTCRFYADDSVDADLLSALAEEGADVVMDGSGNRDFRYLLCRRFLVSDDPSVGHFMVRDADSAVNPREAAAVAEWLESGLPFHTMRDWYTHTDPLLAGMWGGTAGVFPAMASTIAGFLANVPMSTNWDQYFLRDQVWPTIRNDCMVHDRCFGSHAARPFPTPTPPGREHVGQNEFASDTAAQASLLEAFAERVPALGIFRQALNLQFKTTL
ncbi:MAG: hypothetical protein ABI667_09110 [Sphingomicrobium sp.]